MIAIIDYGIGNLRSVEKAFHRVGADAHLTSDPDLVRAADGVVLPGVGAFGACALGLRSAGFEPTVMAVAEAGLPLLGICVGMQLLFEESEEMGQYRGLGLLPGSVLRLPESRAASPGSRLKVPQIGWNQLWHQADDPLLAAIAPGSYAYFVHSYYCQPDHPALIVATTDYGIDYASVVRQDNVWGVQFHPEKSHNVGLQILRNFVEVVAGGTAMPH